MPVVIALRVSAPAAGARMSRGRALAFSAIAGALSITPATFLFALAAYGDLSVLAVGWFLGASYGVLVATLVVWIRGRATRHRDRTG